jgi:hypothetical protein
MDTPPEALDIPAILAEKALADLPPVTALESLAVAHRLAELLIGRRWIDMERAREQGATWTEIGAALGMSKQGAFDWYRNAIERQRALHQEPAPSTANQEGTT